MKNLLTILPVVMLLAACGPGQQLRSVDADSATPVIERADAPQANGSLPGGISLPFPADHSQPQREVSAGGSILKDAGEYSDKSDNAFYSNLDFATILDSTDGSSSWTTYSFNVGTEADVTMALAYRNVVSEGNFYMGLANFQTMRWDWTAFPTELISSDPYVLTEGDSSRYISPAGNTHVACLCFDNAKIAMSNLELYLQAPPAPPQDLTATQGTWYNTIFVKWQAVDSAEMYEIEYQEEGAGPFAWQQLAVVEPQPWDGQFWNHNDDSPVGMEAELDQVYNYRVRAIYNGGGTSPAWSNVASGYRALKSPGLALVSYQLPVDGIQIEWISTQYDTFNLYRDGELLASDYMDDEYHDISPLALDGEEHVYELQGVTPFGNTELSSPRTGRALLIDVSHVNDQPAPIPFGLTLDITSGNLPFSAHINIDKQVAFSWATTPHPAGPQDWNRGLIMDAPEDDVDSHFSVCTCVSNGVPLVFFGRGSANPAVFCAIPTSMPANGPDDWEIHEVIDSPSYVGMMDAAIIGGKPALSWQGSFFVGDPNSGYLCTSVADLPSGGSDWRTTAVTSEGETLTTGLSEVAGRPGLISESDNLRFNFGEILRPVVQDDFLSTYVGDQNTVGDTSGTNFSFSTVAGRPALAYRNNDSLTYAYAGVKLPKLDEDWRIHNVDLGVSSGYETSIADYNPRGDLYFNTPLLSTYSPDTDSIWLVNNESSYPYSSSFGWHSIEPEPASIKHGFSNAMTLQDGLPVIIYSVEEDIAGELKYMRGY